MPGGGGHGRAALQLSTSGKLGVPGGGGGHGGPRPGAPNASQPRAPGRLISAEQLEEFYTCPITQVLFSSKDRLAFDSQYTIVLNHKRF